MMQIVLAILGFQVLKWLGHLVMTFYVLGGRSDDELKKSLGLQLTVVFYFIALICRNLAIALLGASLIKQYILT